ncbi:SLC13 family permease [bacterium]|nr:SLC13 family permease [bacterium]
MRIGFRFTRSWKILFFFVLTNILVFSSQYAYAAETANAGSNITKIWISIGILLIAAILFLTEKLPLAITSLMVPVLLVIFQVIPFKDAFLGFSDQWVLLFLMMFIVGDSLFKVGIADKIGKAIIKISKNNERLVIIYAMLIGGVMSAFLNNTGTAACLLPIMLAISKTSKIEPKKLLIPMVFGVSLGGMLSLIGTPPNGIIQSAYEQATGKAFGFFEFAKPGIFVFIIGILFYATIGMKILDNICKKSSGKVKEYHTDEADAVQVNPTEFRTKKAGVALFVFLLVLFFMIMDPVWGQLFNNEAVVNFFKNIPLVVYAMIGFIILVATKTMSVKESFEAVDWSTIFLFAGMLSLSKALEATGAAVYIGNSIVNVTKVLPIDPKMAALIGLTLISTIVTNFMSNTATAALFAPIAIAIATQLGMNPAPLLMAVGLGASMCFLTPVATPPNTLVVIPGKISFIEFFKAGWLLQLIATIMLILLIPVFFPL